MRRFQHEISGSWAVFRPLQQEIARRCKYTIAVFREYYSSSDLRSRESPLRPHPTFSQVFPAMANFRPGGSLRFGVASRAQHRFVSALRPSSVCLSCPRVYGIGVYYGINNMNLSVGFRPEVPTDGKRALFPMDFCNPFIIIYDFSPFGKQILVTAQ